MKRCIYLLCIIIAAVAAGCVPKGQDAAMVHELEVTPQSVCFDADNPENNTFTVTSNVSWHITCDASIKLDKYDGKDGETVVTVMQMTGTESSTLTVTTMKRNTSEIPVSKDVRVSRISGGGDGPEDPDKYEETLIFYDNLGAENSDEPYLDKWSGNGSTASGSGAGNIRYEGNGLKVTSYVKSSGYPEASGGRAIQFFSGQTLTVRGIELPQGKRTFRFTFGLTGGRNVSLSASSVSLSVANEDGVEKPISCELEKYGDWYLVKGLFSITGKVPERMNVIVSVSETKRRMDDPKLVATTAPADQTIGFGPSEENVYRWAELPQTLVGGNYEYIDDGGKVGDYKYVTHHATTYSSGKNVRNYSACYDTRRHNPMWVAYPCHEIYWEGGYNRPVKDPWRPDPKFEQEEQSIIYSVPEWSNWPWSSSGGRPNDLYWYWSPLNSGNTVTKGHLMRSAERGNGTNGNSLTRLNEQTFYPTNISPEYLPYVVTGKDNNGKDITQSYWGMVEDILPNKWRCNDTLFVVAGCYYENDNTVLYDACNWGEHSSYSKKCVVPTAKYKLIMRTKKGNTGKNIAECSADEVMAIGFWFEQSLNDNPKLQELPPLRTVTFSVSDIEKKLGNEFSFFPTLPDVVKEIYNVNDWPGLSDIIDKTYESIE